MNVAYRKRKDGGVCALAWVGPCRQSGIRVGCAFALHDTASCFAGRRSGGRNGDRRAQCLHLGLRLEKRNEDTMPGPSNAYSWPTWTADGRYLLLQGAGGLYWARADAAKDPQLFIKAVA
jgi:hypothetical protein